MIVPDANARAQALDPTTSFCVSAPAGSGKTGLLVQRFMNLLGHVSDPERVVAITFTRKAAAEMRARVTEALDEAQCKTAVRDEHQRRTRSIAMRVLEVDARLRWGLLQNPSRLRILTIDAFCAELVRQMPLLSGSGGPLAVTDDANDLYREAVQDFFDGSIASQSAQTREDIGALLLHLENDWEAAADLLLNLLARRDQWQPVLGAGGLGAEDRDALRALSEELVQKSIGELRVWLQPLLPELEALVAYRQGNDGDLPGFSASGDRLGEWLGVVDLLLTKQGEWRRQVNRKDGFPAGKGEAADRKAEVLGILQALREADDVGLKASLQQLRFLPDTEADPEHWELLAAVSRLLPRLSAQLLLVFQRAGEVDHAQIAMSAVTALGDDEHPTDLALRLDYTIEHLLVDEFQDTSSGQFELLRRLTRGWSEHNARAAENPRTLFVVGDAMQSIYGFRNANVGLFIRAREKGIGDLRLEALDLEVNFRSSGALVNWVNRTFIDAFPAVDNAQLGAVSFRPSTAAHSGGSPVEIKVYAGEDATQAEADGVCDELLPALADPAIESIAILGRTRNQLQPILAALRRRGIEFSAQDIDILSWRPLIRDLATLCEVLTNRWDGYSWLALLRTPAVALDHRDLLEASQRCPDAASLLDGDAEALNTFSAPGQQRLRHLKTLLQWAEHYRDRLALRVWVEECWLRLGGAAAIENDADCEDLEQFFQGLEMLDQRGLAPNGSRLSELLSRLYASDGAEQCKLKVMTLHKAKGLEFDWVFIPATARTQRSGSSELLLWDEFVLREESTAFLLDIRPDRDADQDRRVYGFLKEQLRRKRMLETVRLFYVGCTRASQRLFISAGIDLQDDGEVRTAPASSFLGSLGDSLEGALEVVHSGASTSPEAASSGYRRLRRSPSVEAVPALSFAAEADFTSNLSSRILGTAIHRCVESLVYRSSLPDDADESLRALLHMVLREGCPVGGVLGQLERDGMEAVDRLLKDPWARWMLAPQRRERAAELPVTVYNEGQARNLIIDYSFVDEKTDERWIVDYKSAAPPAGVAETLFMQQQIEHYAEQLHAYREALSALHGSAPRCALYFTALGSHREWLEAERDAFLQARDGKRAER